MFNHFLINNVNDNDGDENGTSKKLPDFPIEKYKAFGDLAPEIKQQGWFPEYEDKTNDNTEFRTNYGQFSTVKLDPSGKKLGYVSIIGGNKTGLFDVVIKDNSGKPVFTIMKSQPANQVNKWITSGNNTVGERVRNIASGNISPTDNVYQKTF